MEGVWTAHRDKFRLGSMSGHELLLSKRWCNDAVSYETIHGSFQIVRPPRNLALDETHDRDCRIQDMRCTRRASRCFPSMRIHDPGRVRMSCGWGYNRCWFSAA